jgi:hypothetical protein
MTGPVYPYQSELGSWVDTLTPVQFAIWERFRDSNMSDWPGSSFDEIKAIGVGWGLGICTEMVFEAIACWIHHNVTGHQVPAYLKNWLEGREEMTG